MLNRKTALAVSLAFLSSAALADVASDVEAGLSVEQIIVNAKAEGLSPQDTINQIAQVHLDLVSSAVSALAEATPEQAEVIVSAALLAAPSKVETIVIAALKAAPGHEEGILTAALMAEPTQSEVITQVAAAAGVANEVIVTASISAGSDPTQAGQATAAGIKK